MKVKKREGGMRGKGVHSHRVDRNRKNERKMLDVLGQKLNKMAIELCTRYKIELRTMCEVGGGGSI